MKIGFENFRLFVNEISSPNYNMAVDLKTLLSTHNHQADLCSGNHLDSCSSNLVWVTSYLYPGISLFLSLPKRMRTIPPIFLKFTTLQSPYRLTL
jgi:hypothetical protein